MATPDLAERTDAQLVAAAVADDLGAFEELVRRHRDRAYGIAYRVCRDPGEAEEVAQEAFVRVWRSLHTFRGDAQFTTWLYRIVTNLALTRVGRQVDRPTAELPDHADASLDPARRFGAGERLSAALAALERLSPDQRACYVLREVEGLTYEEVAEVLDTTVAAVKGRLFRARQDLAEALAAHDREDAS